MHLKNLKPSPPASAIVDRCIECGFCESNCPSRDITLTPRQRITTWREISRLQTIEGRSPAEQQRCAPAAPCGTCDLSRVLLLCSVCTSCVVSLVSGDACILSSSSHEHGYFAQALSHTPCRI